MNLGHFNLHELKCWPYHYRSMESGTKTAEIRRNDRNFQNGDLIWLREWVPEQDRDKFFDFREDTVFQRQVRGTGYTGQSLFLRISRVDEAMGLEEGYVLLSTQRLKIEVQL